jgi:hypothetical protein
LTYTITGIVEQVDDTTLKISELPVRKWTQDYKEFLETMMTVSEKNKEPFIKVKNFFDVTSILAKFMGLISTTGSLVGFYYEHLYILCGFVTSADVN